MKPYGRRKPCKCTVEGHQYCSICHPFDVDKSRERQAAKRDIKKEIQDLNQED